MASKSNDWIFEEHQRDAVSSGKLCPKCLSEDIEYLGCAPTFTETNASYCCRKCREEWEGY